MIATIAAQSAAAPPPVDSVAEAAISGAYVPLTWDAFLQSVRDAEERARLINVSADGKTLHAFTRLPSLEWSYVPVHADALVEWATVVVLARDNPELLGTIH